MCCPSSSSTARSQTDVVELLDLAEAIGFDPHAVIDELGALPGQLERKKQRRP